MKHWRNWVVEPRRDLVFLGMFCLLSMEEEEESSWLLEDASSGNCFKLYILIFPMGLNRSVKENTPDFRFLMTLIK
jgi:hypothetical protein